MKEEHRITYKAGITRSPSDFLCDNGELSECINLTIDSEEVKVLIPPKPNGLSLDPDQRLLFVHTINNQKFYICQDTDGGLSFKYHNGTKYADRAITSEKLTIEKVSAIGKTLIINALEGIRYAIWKSTDDTSTPYSYSVLDDIPTPNVEFYTTDYRTEKGFEYVYSTDARYGNALTSAGGIKDQEKYNDFIIGLYAELKKLVHQKKAFLNPFLARVAVQLYDGSYTKITNPVLLFPSVSKSCVLAAVGLSGSDPCRMYAKPANLAIQVKTDYRDYVDIVKDIVLFLSPEIDIYDTSVDQTIVSVKGGLKFDGIRNGLFMRESTLNGNDGESIYDPLAHRDSSEIRDDIIASSVFYRVASLGSYGSPTYNSLASLVATHTLENLTTQEQLPNDDYYSHAPFSADFSYVYNSRLNIFGLHRGFFNGFGHFLRYYANDSQGTNPFYRYEIFVTIETDSGNRIVRKSVYTRERMGIWFYYPDPRATLARIYCYTDNAGNTLANPRLIHTLTLTEHPALNGAYYFAGLPTNNAYAPTGTTVSELPATKTEYEYLPNEVATSVVNNPFVFNAEGYNAVSNGKVIGVATQTTALSQGQFGQYPLILFTTEGIWAMQVSETGLYSNITPISRDVATNPNAIIETDGAVFFPSSKGLMQIVGSTVTCVSEKLNGRVDSDGTYMASNIPGNDEEFFAMLRSTLGDQGIIDFLSAASCQVTYDYRNSRLLFIRSDKKFILIYDIRARSFTKLYNQNVTYAYAVKDYPDYLIADNSGDIYSLILVGDENKNAALRYGVLVTRPMKFSGPVSIDSLRELHHVGKWNVIKGSANSSFVKTAIFFSDDLQHWSQATSRFGVAAKYWRWALYIAMRPYERLSGTIVRTQPRRTDNTR